MELLPVVGCKGKVDIGRGTTRIQSMDVLEKNDPRHRPHHEYRDPKSIGGFLDLTDHHERKGINGA
ncbi:hypothetical protein RZS08_47335, partial [Arthrospira platensis SPKY1]|nr:hypothetical protein [Arthrospira platensis SPKY1]